MDGNTYKPDDDLYTMIYKNILWGIVGIILGLCINILVSSKLSDIITGQYQDELRVILQLVLCSVVLAFVHVKVSNHFGWTWQNVTHGLFFVSFFFGVQYSMFTYMQSINNNWVAKILGKNKLM